MPININRRKPRLELLPGWIALRPSKNYVFNLLYQHLQAAKPTRSLDAATGKLRNRWMFPGEYIGITKHRSEYFAARQLPPGPIKRPAPAHVYLMLMERDFSFLGPMDISVSTYTLQYLEEKHADVVHRLSQRVRRGGSIFIQNEISTFDAAVAAIEPYFSEVEVIFTEHASLADLDQRSDIMGLSSIEMNVPNKREDHLSYCLIGRRKIQPEEPAGPMPSIRNDDGLLIVERDLDECVMD